MIYQQFRKKINSQNKQINQQINRLSSSILMKLQYYQDVYLLLFQISFYIQKYQKEIQINCYYESQSVKLERLIQLAKAEPKPDVPILPIDFQNWEQNYELNSQRKNKKKQVQQKQKLKQIKQIKRALMFQINFYNQKQINCFYQVKVLIAKNK
ncbi:hypothetical protein TTHERM_000835399 (macronuclear) [Tetrahymena thermophila SB210]|uniref:Uncharacterized protein n=1 Tax=Tetrahymena thermophila (strain SB210) TaxID=312017 RepID=W7XFE3_TETTS|nr:hypothetical protein TTHERM_000835399 [Tetrahymena thermophila SB210]EWS75553.1 hypothetical protein TTHERM_000835399 [Tetrahymena thermophila SB210]|eukprot:XP_012651919.1 hypothetical protein TTHERM_000835399 [Tetrahymena thermophila SB210]